MYPPKAWRQGLIGLWVWCLCQPLAQAEPQHWQFGNLYSANSVFAGLYRELARDIETLTKGSLQVDVVFAGAAMPAQGLLDAVKRGELQMAAPFQSMHAGELPAGVIEVGLPGTTADIERIQTLFRQKGFGKVLEKAYAAQELVWLEPYIQPPVYVLTREPIERIEDFRGLRIRAPGAYGRFFRNLGASTVSMAWSDIRPALAAGEIDGAIGSNLIDHRDGGHIEFAPYLYPLPVAGAQVLPILVNRQAWKQLSESQQTAVRLAAERHADAQLHQSRVWEAEALAELEEQGLRRSSEPSEKDHQAWRRAATHLYEEYAAKDKYSRQLINILKNNDHLL